MKILIVGIVKDVAKVLEYQISIIQRAFESFGEILWFLVESDSSDNTVKVLERCNDSIKNFNYVSLGPMVDHFPDRTMRLAYCRNEYIKALDAGLFGDVEYVVIADFDAANLLLTEDAVRNVLNTKDQWDVVTANQIGPYYDIWALRHPLWCPDDCYRIFKFYLGLGVNKIQALESSILSKMMIIPKNAPLIPVFSSFGGLGIYKRNVLYGRRYKGVDDFGEIVSEHVPLNLSITRDGHRMFIAPILINSEYNEHNSRKKLFSRFIRTVKCFLQEKFLIFQ